MTVQNHLYRITWTPVLLVIMSAVSAADTDARSNTLPTAGYIDEAVFREGLRQRGLTDLLEQYFQDNPPLNKIDAQMRQREELLEKASQQIIPNHQRESIIDKASDILSKLIEKHPNHPARLRWRYELARDILERKDPTIFDILLLYELPGRDRVKAGKLSRRAIEVLNHLRQQIDAIWQAAEALDETALEQVTVSGALQSVEAIDMQSAFLLSWARLYHALSVEPAEAQPSAVWSDLLAQVTEKYGWIKLPAGRETQQCSALIIAATAARRLGQFNEANDYARQIITSLAQVDNPETRKQLSRASLTAVLEQIRILRDRNRQDDAQKAIKQAYDWAKRTRPDDIQTDLALALTEHSLLTGKLPTATKPTETNHIETFILHHHSLAPLKQLANKSPSHRDALYSILAGALETESLNISRTTFALQLIVGAAVMDARINRSASHSATDKRLHEVIDALENTSFEVSPDTLFSIAELSYLSAQAYYLAGRHLTAVNKLLSYVDSYQSHDRATDAARQAVAIAQEMLNKPQWHNSAKARTAFVRAAKLMQKHFPDSPQARRLQYFIALTLEQNQKLTEAADEYARVAIDDPDALKAALGRTRCLTNTLNHASANRTLSESEIKKLAQKTLRAAQQGVKTAGRIIHQQSTKDDRCLNAEIVLTLANLLNTSHINTPAQALTTLQNFETRFAECPESIGPALRQRILAHRELKQLAQARQVVQQYLSTSPDTAGPVMARLLEAMRNEIDAAADRGNKQEQTDLAAEAHQLAKMLIDWSEQRPQQVSPTDLLTIRTWQAWSLLNAGKPADAFSLYQTCQKIGDHLLPANSTSNMEIRLGKAECLLALGKVNDALPIFMNVWQNSPEHSTPWWRSFVGCLESHNRLKKNPNQILQSIQQQKHLSPDLGGPRWKRALENIEKNNQNRIQNSTHQ